MCSCSCFSWLYKIYQRYTVGFGFLKTLASAVFSLIFVTAWINCNKNQTSPSQLHCTSTIPYDWDCAAFGSVRWCSVNYYGAELGYPTECSVPCQFGGFSVARTTGGGCEAFSDNECVCSYWLAFSLVLILTHILQFLLQLVFFYFYDDFDPQKLLLVASTRPVSMEVFWKLVNPRNGLTSVIEVFCLVYLWSLANGDPKGSSINCYGDSFLDLSNGVWYFCALMTLIELMKPNIYLMMSANFCGVMVLDQILGSVYLLRIDISLRFAWIQTSQMLSFVASILCFGIPFCFFEDNYEELCQIVEGYEKTATEFSTKKTAVPTSDVELAATPKSIEIRI